MGMRWILLVRCLLGKHRPDRKHVSYDGYTFVGRCAGCRSLMFKDESDRWAVGDAPAHQASS
jgi:hypothetical protein